jgi:hypothetical protein
MRLYEGHLGLTRPIARIQPFAFNLKLKMIDLNPASNTFTRYKISVQFLFRY